MRPRCQVSDSAVTKPGTLQQLGRQAAGVLGWREVMISVRDVRTVHFDVDPRRWRERRRISVAVAVLLRVNRRPAEDLWMTLAQ